MHPVVIDLAGDPQWAVVARKRGARYVLLADTDFWVARPADRVFVVDGRGRYDAGLDLISKLAPGASRIFLTERESPREQERAYRAGTTRIVLMLPGDQGHDALLADAIAAGRR